jgi:hypothetical protein
MKTLSMKRLAPRSIALCAAALSLFSSLSGCAVPQFDVPQSRVGLPTARSIVSRIECELLDMVRDDREGDPASLHRLFLLNGDYEVEAILSLDVNDAGGLSPSLSYIDPLKGATSFVFGANATLSETREHNFTENLQFSFRDLFVRWKADNRLFSCPEAETNLAGELGLKQFVALAASSHNLDESIGLGSKGPFGGSVQFIVTKNLSAIGPTWTLTHFKGPGGAALSEINTDKLTVAFARGPDAGHKMNLRAVQVARAPNPVTNAYLQQLQLGAISTQLSNLPFR